MIDGFDDAMREFLIREMPVQDNEIDIDFEMPKREWSARLSRPTLNMFLRDIRENSKLRSPQPAIDRMNSGDPVKLGRHPVRLDLFYLITAWAKDPLDEHRILARVLAALFRYRAVPPDIVAQYMPGQEVGVPLKLAQYDTQFTPGDLWSVLDNELRPSIDIVATIMMQPYAMTEAPMTRGIELRYSQMGRSRPATNK
jgi:hypothetical protein